MYLVKFSDNTETAVDIRQSSARRGRWEAHLPDGEILTLVMKGKDDNGHYVISINDVDTSVSLQATRRGYLLAHAQFEELVTVSRAAEVVFEHDTGAPPKEPDAEYELQSPITGVLLDVYVSPGMPVSAGQAVLLIEAMKMENTLEAMAEMRVAEVLVKAGDTVFVGDPLIRYAPLSDTSS